jgi:hypothetical protein
VHHLWTFLGHLLGWLNGSTGAIQAFTATVVMVLTCVLTQNEFLWASRIVYGQTVRRNIREELLKYLQQNVTHAKPPESFGEWIEQRETLEFSATVY